MPFYSQASLQKHPWLWKYDSRRNGNCKHTGHRFIWYRQQEAEHHFFFGLCKKCDANRFYSIQVDQLNRITQIQKQPIEVKTVELTPEEAASLLANAHLERYQDKFGNHAIRKQKPAK